MIDRKSDLTVELARGRGQLRKLAIKTRSFVALDEIAKVFFVWKEREWVSSQPFSAPKLDQRERDSRYRKRLKWQVCRLCIARFQLNALIGSTSLFGVQWSQDSRIAIFPQRNIVGCNEFLWLVSKSDAWKKGRTGNMGSAPMTLNFRLFNVQTFKVQKGLINVCK